MTAGVIHSSRSDDARLWLTALLLSLGINVGVVLFLAFMAIQTLIFQPPTPSEQAAEPESRSITIQPVTSEKVEPPAAERPKAFARTSDDQTAEIPEDPAFIGERDTVATSEADPVEGMEDLPSQEGIEPRAGEIETTVSEYQDGVLEHDRAATPGEEEPSPMPEEVTETVTEPVEPVTPSGTETESPDEEASGERQRLAEGPLSVDRPISPDMAEEEPKASPEERAEEEIAKVEEEVEEQPKPAKPQATNEPGFRGYQRRTLLKGSISRRGTASLDVKEGALGRYHAAIGRAIEQAWQRRVIQHRDLITPGVIRIQVVLDENGRVRSVGTVEEFGIGAIQKGFTHKAIREANLPKMPDDVRRELQGEPLELLYNFIF
ncbi:hypothetical protein [Haloferula rosea]|uniref:TonB C-terminal domain-containing protein n=1 Tax=Haloferula rosea TaxID=490093 RepID=A0A934VG06_9BACT|nr:hypothetical protein [Haloferula rosea]MBK1827596.1 hypothetical protein [Haloferula rosea]